MLSDQVQITADQTLTQKLLDGVFDIKSHNELIFNPLFYNIDTVCLVLRRLLN